MEAFNCTIVSLSLAAGLSLIASQALPQEFTWKASSPFVESREETKALQRWADRIQSESEGKLKIDVYAGGSLGVKDVDMLRVLPENNALQVAHLYPGYLSRDVPEIASTLPPGVIDDPQALVTLSPVLQKIYQDIYDKWELTFLGYTYQPVQTTSVMCKEPINSLADLNNKKVRVWEKHTADTFQKLGISAQIIPQADLYVALQTGVIDCAVYNVGYAKTSSIQEVAPYEAYLFPYVTHPVNLVVTNAAWEALPEELQQVVEKVTADVQQETLGVYLAGTFDSEAREELATLGLKPLDAYSEADQKAFQEAAVQTWEEMAKEAGEAALANKEKILNALGQ